MLSQMGKRGPREGERLVDSHTANLAAGPELCLPPWLVICVPFSSFLTPCPKARTQKQLLEMVRPDPHAVQEAGSLEATRRDIKLTVPGMALALNSSLKICIQPQNRIKGPCKE